MNRSVGGISMNKYQHHEKNKNRVEEIVHSTSCMAKLVFSVSALDFPGGATLSRPWPEL